MGVRGRYIRFSAHALEQMYVRLGFTLDYETRDELLDNSTEISNEEAYEIVGDPSILSPRNKKGSKYYMIDLSDDYILDIFEDNGYDTAGIEDLIIIFVIRDNCCVTFKTSRESNIFSNLKTFEYSKRVCKEKSLPDYYYYAEEM